MSFIVIESHGGAEYAIVCTDTDGNNVVFETRNEAEAKNRRLPKAGFVVEIDGFSIG
jgi:hypothetical protein